MELLYLVLQALQPHLPHHITAEELAEWAQSDSEPIEQIEAASGLIEAGVLDADPGVPFEAYLLLYGSPA